MYLGLCTDWKFYQLILFNIYQNAIKYSKVNGCITISTSIIQGLDSIIEGSLISQEYYLITDVSDQGEGISSNRQKYLFEPFKELKNTM